MYAIASQSIKRAAKPRWIVAALLLARIHWEATHYSWDKGQVRDLTSNNTVQLSNTANLTTEEAITNLGLVHFYKPIVVVWLEGLQGNNDDENTSKNTNATYKEYNRSYTVEALGKGLKKQKEIQDHSTDDNNPQTALDEIPDDCETQYEWQGDSLPIALTCNWIHEQDLHSLLLAEQFQYVAKGGYRLVWKLSADNQNSFALKTWHYDNRVKGGWVKRNFNRHWRDARVSGRLTSSPYVVNQYAYCGNTGLYDFAGDGTLEHYVEKHHALANGTSSFSWTHRLQLAYQVARGVADLHNIDQEGRASIVHADLDLSQFVGVRKADIDNHNKNGSSSLQSTIFQLNDFNRARYLYRNKTNTQDNCPFFIQSTANRLRSPEEFLHQPETEKIDVYSMGNILYTILTGKQPFHNIKSDNKIKGLIKEGTRPTIPKQYFKNPQFNKDPQLQAMVQAIQMCWIHSPTERASARSVEHLLAKALRV